MLRSISIFAVISVVAAGTAANGDGNDLFSDVRTGAVFSVGKPNDSQNVPARITDAESLRELLNTVGFEATIAGTRAVTLKKSLDPWAFPVLLTISEDEQNIAIALGLRTIKDSKELTADVLLKMMAISHQSGSLVFTYSASRERTELYSVSKNQGLTGQVLRDEINRMAIAAKENSTLWADSQKPATEQKAGLEPDPAASTVDLVGRWSAAKSATEAFAVEFTADASFSLIYINNGKQTKSSGKFSLTTTGLTLDGSDGLKLAGTFASTSTTEFKFTPEKGTVLTFTRAK